MPGIHERYGGVQEGMCHSLLATTFSAFLSSSCFLFVMHCPGAATASGATLASPGGAFPGRRPAAPPKLGGAKWKDFFFCGGGGATQPLAALGPLPAGVCPSLPGTCLRVCAPPSLLVVLVFRACGSRSQSDNLPRHHSLPTDSEPLYHPPPPNEPMDNRRMKLYGNSLTACGTA